MATVVVRPVTTLLEPAAVPADAAVVDLAVVVDANGWKSSSSFMAGFTGDRSSLHLNSEIQPSCFGIVLNQQ